MNAEPADGLVVAAPTADVDRVLSALSRHAVELRSQAVPPTRIRFSACGVSLELTWPAPAPVSSSCVVPPVEAATAGVGGSPSSSGAAAGCHQVCSHTVGVFYHGPEPGAEPFVTEGDLVVAGQQVGIVEAMKLMVPVEADRTGWVLEVLVANGAPVEHGQPLLLLGSPDSAPGNADDVR